MPWAILSTEAMAALYLDSAEVFISVFAIFCVKQNKYTGNKEGLTKQKWALQG